MKTGEKEKTTVNHRIRKRVHTTVSPETYEYLKKCGVNASRLLDNAVFELRKVPPRSLVLMSQKEVESWAWPDSNRRSSPCKGDVMTG